MPCGVKIMKHVLNPVQVDFLWWRQSIYYQMVGQFVQRDFQMIFQGYFLISVKVNQNCINLGVRNMCKAI